MKKKFILLTLPFLCFFSSMSHAVVAGGIVSMRHQWPLNAQFNKMSFNQQINNDGGNNSHYFWANQFFFKGGDGGYIGLQNRGGGVKAFNYSIWGATGWKSGKCTSFGHEGDGVQCDIIYPWKTGHTYKLDVSKSGNVVTGNVVDLTDGTSTLVGKIQVPNTYGKLYSSSSFVEEYSQGNGQLTSCYAMGAQSSISKNPIGDNSIVAKQSSTTYGNCNDPYIVTATCNASFCQNTVNDLKSVPSPAAPAMSFVNNQVITQATLSGALNGKDLIVIRLEDGKWAPSIYFPTANSVPWKSIAIDQKASSITNLYVMSNGYMRASRGQQLMFTSVGGVWKQVK